MDLNFSQMVMIVVTATLASIGTAGTSGAGMIMLAMVLVGIDPTYIGLIYGIDRLFDMGRTSLNVIGDASCAVCVNHWEGRTANVKQ